MEAITRKELDRIEEIYIEGGTIDWVVGECKNKKDLGACHYEGDARYACIQLFPVNHKNQRGTRRSVYTTACHEAAEAAIGWHIYAHLPESLHDEKCIEKLCHALSCYMERVVSRAFEAGAKSNLKSQMKRATGARGLK